MALACGHDGASLGRGSQRLRLKDPASPRARLAAWLASELRWWQLGGMVLVLALFSGCDQGPPKHGTSFLLEIVSGPSNLVERTQGQSDTYLTVRRRLDRSGLRFSIESLAEGRFMLKVAPVRTNDLELARALFSRAGKLEFRLVHPDSAEMVAAKIPEPGYELLTEQRLSGGTVQSIPMLVKKEPERGLTGKYLRRVNVQRNRFTGDSQIDFELNAEGARIFEAVTSEYQPRDGRYHQLAIVLDGRLCSAPRLMGVIRGGRGQITGSFDIREASQLANMLEHPLESTVRVVEERSF